MKTLKKDLKIILMKQLSLSAALVMTAAAALWGCGKAPADSALSQPAGTSQAADQETSSGPDLETAAPAETMPSTVDDGSVQPVVFTDSLGREVTVHSPMRTAAMIGSFADIWCLAGGKNSLVAAAHDTWTYFDLGLDESVADIGNTSEPNLEILTAADPDFIIASSNTDADVKLLDTFESMGMNVAYFQVSNFDEYLHMLDICTQITGEREYFQQYGLQIQDQIDRAKAAADGSSPTVLYVRASSSSCKVKNSKGSVLGEMLADLGCINIADSGDSLLEDLNMEAILAADPDYIFVVLQGADKESVTQTLDKNLLSQPAWQSLTAVQEGRYHIMDDTLYNLKPNARWGVAYEELAKLLYPESFQ